MSKQLRWQDKKGISDLSVAVDEIYFLRALLADEADILEAHLALKTFPKSRRAYAEEQLERMRFAAAGNVMDVLRSGFSAQIALRRAGIVGTLTNDQWAHQRGLILVEENGEDNDTIGSD
jgi:hypothetical protein